MLDKNGKEIYENDLVSDEIWSGNVVFENGEFIVASETRWIPIWKDIEVIGTIFDKEVE